MSQKSSCLNGAQEVRETDSNRSRSPVCQKNVQDGDGEKGHDSPAKINERTSNDNSAGCAHIDGLQEVEECVTSVMSSQPVQAVLGTPTNIIATGRKIHLSLSAMSGTDIKKIRSDRTLYDLDQTGDISGTDDESDIENVDEPIVKGAATIRTIVCARRRLMGEK